MVRELSKNPLILACVIGGMGCSLEFADAFPISGLAPTGQAAPPMGVLCLGAGLQWQAVRAGLGLTSFSVVAQLLAINVPSWRLDGLADDWVLVGLLLIRINCSIELYFTRQLGEMSTMAGLLQYRQSCRLYRYR